MHRTGLHDDVVECVEEGSIWKRQKTLWIQLRLINNTCRVRMLPRKLVTRGENQLSPSC